MNIPKPPDLIDNFVAAGYKFVKDHRYRTVFHLWRNETGNSIVFWFSISEETDPERWCWSAGEYPIFEGRTIEAATQEELVPKIVEWKLAYGK